MDATNYQRQVLPMQSFDPTSALQLAETREIINNIFYDLCGLQPVKQGDNVHYIRVTRPVFTYEFAKDIITKLYIEVNLITSRTTYDTEKIKIYLKKGVETMRDWFAMVGIDKLISERAWQKVNELGQVDPESVEFNKDGSINENNVSKNFWSTKHNLEWDYNQPVNDDMLRIVKEEFLLQEESFGQDVILRDRLWSIRQFIEGGINKSREALTLDHEKIIHKESIITNNDEGRNRRGEGFIDNVKRIFGGSR